MSERPMSLDICIDLLLFLFIVIAWLSLEPTGFAIAFFILLLTFITELFRACKLSNHPKGNQFFEKMNCVNEKGPYKGEIKCSFAIFV